VVPPSTITPWCKSDSATIQTMPQMKYQQERYWGSRNWRASFSRRTYVEGCFGNLKNNRTGNIHRGFMQSQGQALVTLAITAAVVASTCVSSKPGTCGPANFTTWSTGRHSGPATRPAAPRPRSASPPTRRTRSTSRRPTSLASSCSRQPSKRQSTPPTLRGWPGTGRRRRQADRSQSLPAGLHEADFSVRQPGAERTPNHWSVAFAGDMMQPQRPTRGRTRMRGPTLG
jgi:hypothetical protein